uniref:Uncharacterized protein n=1 Tax=Picea sitchensis TaxID=3332 RepID=A9NXK3_PICSI|nr:unknown [Picea sitchensis]
MATRSKVRFSETPVQHNNQEQQSSGWSSWLFGGRRSKDGHEENDNSSRGHNSVQTSAKVGEHHAAHSGKASHDVKPAAEEVNDESVDKEAAEFIEKQRKKLEMERLMSMKRVESMLNRGL